MSKVSVAAIVLALVAVVAAFVALSKPGQIVVERVVGSASSPSVINGCTQIDGVETCYYTEKMVSASTTCSFPAPKSASSTLIYAAAKFVERAGGGYSAEWGKANTAFATTTSFGNLNGAVSANGNQYFQASTTLEKQNNSNLSFATTEFLNLKIGSTSLSSLTTGVCTAVFRVN